MERDNTSYKTILKEILDKTSGAVIEIGAGLDSTPLLNEYADKRNVISYEDNEYWYNQVKQYNTKNHKVLYVERYTPIEEQAEVVFIDSFPVGERHINARQFAESDYIIVHDMDLCGEQFDNVFLYRKDYPELLTSVFSNKLNLIKE